MPRSVAAVTMHAVLGPRYWSSTSVRTRATAACTSKGSSLMAAMMSAWPWASATRATLSSRARNTMRYTPRTEVLRVWPKPVGMPARFSSSMTMCSSTWPHQVPSCRRCRKPPRSPTPQWCSTRAGSQAVSRSLKPGSVLEGWSSSTPRSSQTSSTGR